MQKDLLFTCIWKTKLGSRHNSKGECYEITSAVNKISHKTEIIFKKDIAQNFQQISTKIKILVF